MITVPRFVGLSFLLAAFVVEVAAAPQASAEPAARMQTVAVLPPTGDNIAPELLRAAGDILKDPLERAGTYGVIEPPMPPPPAPPAGTPPGTVLPPSSEELTAA